MGDPTTLTAAYLQSVGADSARPLITYYDRTSGERTELSAATFDNWVSKTANLMRDELLLEPGAMVGIAMAPHWQSAAIMCGAWRLGCCVTENLDAVPLAALFCPEPRLMELADHDADNIIVSSMHPLGVGVSVKPDHVVDYTTEVRIQGDIFTPYGAPDPAALALRSGSLQFTQHAALTTAQQLAAGLGLHAGERLMLDVSTAGEAGVLTWLGAPLIAHSAVVLIRGSGESDDAAWAASIAQQENATYLDGHPHIGPSAGHQQGID